MRDLEGGVSAQSRRRDGEEATGDGEGKGRKLRGMLSQSGEAKEGSRTRIVYGEWRGWRRARRRRGGRLSGGRASRRKRQAARAASAGRSVNRPMISCSASGGRSSNGDGEEEDEEDGAGSGSSFRSGSDSGSIAFLDDGGGAGNDAFPRWGAWAGD